MAMEHPMKSYRRYQGKNSSTLKKLLVVLLVLVLAVTILYGALLGVVLSGSHGELDGEAGIMLIFGYQILPSGEAAPLLCDRLDAALSYLETHPDMTVVVSGGQTGSEPISEARVMADYLIERGYSAENILLEERASNTAENILYSIELLAAEGYDVTDNILAVSNGFHLARIRMLWGRFCGGTYNLLAIAAPSNDALARLHMHIREPFALIKSFLIDRGV